MAYNSRDSDKATKEMQKRGLWSLYGPSKYTVDVEDVLVDSTPRQNILQELVEMSHLGS